VAISLRTFKACALAWACAVSLVAAVPADATPSVKARTVDGKVSDWSGSSTRLGGTWQYSAEEFVYQDHLYDDLGAETRQRSQQHGNATGAPQGDYRYPTDEKRYGHNAADLLELRIAADRDALWVLARMNTLKVPDATVVAIGIDTDRKASSGGGDWPYAAGLAVAGVDRVITLWGTGATVTKLPSGSRVRVHEVAVNASNDHNAIEARIPRSMIGGDDVVRVRAATGLWDKANSQWMAVPPGGPSTTTPGGGSTLVAPRAFNVAFRDNETGSFMEERQAQALAAGDISQFGVDVDLGALVSGASRPYKVRTRRFYAAVVDQKLTIPPYHEGVSYEGVPGRFAGVGGAALTQKFSFFGRHQPYGLYVPSTYDGERRIGAALALHGHGGSHSTYNSQPGFLRDMGEGEGTKQPPLFLITPLARGSSFYADWGEADTLAVLKDVFARFPIDRDRLYLTGYSMGGYGVYRLASVYPDRFAAAASWAGYTGEFLGAYLTDPRTLAGDPTGRSDEVSGAVRPTLSDLGVGGGRQGKASIGDPVDTLENLRYLPVVHLAGTNDEIVPTTGQYAAPRRLAELGYRSRFDLYPGYEHFSFAVVDDWKQVRAWLGNRRRERAPREITHRFSDGWTASGLASKIGLEHGNAWWLRDLSMRKTTEDALEFAWAKAVSRASTSRSVTVTQAVTPADVPTPHVQQSVSWNEGPRMPVSNRLDLDTQGVGSVEIDAARAHLKLCGLRIGLRTDGPLTLRLSGAVPRGTKVVGQKAVIAQVQKNVLILRIQKGAAGALAVDCP
jgi:dienelactone hydrolase